MLELVDADDSTDKAGTKWRRAALSLFNSMSDDEKKAVQGLATTWEKQGHPLDAQYEYVARLHEISDVLTYIPEPSNLPSSRSI